MEMMDKYVCAKRRTRVLTRHTTFIQAKQCRYNNIPNELEIRQEQIGHMLELVFGFFHEIIKLRMGRYRENDKLSEEKRNEVKRSLEVYFCCIYRERNRLYGLMRQLPSLNARKYTTYTTDGLIKTRLYVLMEEIQQSLVTVLNRLLFIKIYSIKEICKSVSYRIGNAVDALKAVYTGIKSYRLSVNLCDLRATMNFYRLFYDNRENKKNKFSTVIQDIDRKQTHLSYMRRSVDLHRRSWNRQDRDRGNFNKRCNELKRQIAINRDYLNRNRDLITKLLECRDKMERGYFARYCREYLPDYRSSLVKRNVDTQEQLNALQKMKRVHIAQFDFNSKRVKME